MRKITRRVEKSARKIMEARGFHAGPEHLERDLNASLGLYLMDSGRWRALHALASVFFAVRHQQGRDDSEFNGIDPSARIEVPWWAVRALVLGWMEWLDGREGRSRKFQLGQTLEVERLARGKVSPYETAQRQDRDRRLALLVAQKRPLKMESAVADVAGEAGLKDRTVWEAWNNYGDAATQAISKLKNRPL